MKKIAMAVSLMTLAGAVGLADPPAVPAKGGPCKQIIQACEQAGFQKNMHKTDGKGLYKDCLDPILAGQSVAGVTVDPSIVTSCQEKRAKRQQKKQAAPASTTAQ